MTKTELQSYRALQMEKRQILRLLSAMDNELTRPRSPQLTGMPHTGSADNDRLEELIDRRAETLSRLQEQEFAIEKRLSEIEAAIQTLPEMERVVVRYKYIFGWGWERIGRAIGYSARQAQRVHGRALWLLGRG